MYELLLTTGIKGLKYFCLKFQVLYGREILASENFSWWFVVNFKRFQKICLHYYTTFFTTNS